MMPGGGGGLSFSLARHYPALADADAPAAKIFGKT
jgi:hypothetical protein